MGDDAYGVRIAREIEAMTLAEPSGERCTEPGYLDELHRRRRRAGGGLVASQACDAGQPGHCPSQRLVLRKSSLDINTDWS